MTKIPNVQKVIKLLSKVDAKIKFEGDEVTYQLAPAVLEKVDFDKYKIRSGSTVEVGIVDTTVNFLKKIKVEEQGTTSTPAPSLDPTMKQYTLQSVAASKAVVKFKDYQPESWIQVKEDLQKLDFQALGIVARATVSVKIETIEGKETIVEIKALPKTEEAKPAWQGKSKWQGKSGGYDSPERQTSIEAQASVNSACEVVAKMTLTNIEAVKAGIKEIATANFQLIQELKKK